MVREEVLVGIEAHDILEGRCDARLRVRFELREVDDHIGLEGLRGKPV
jgi:hypothetical protein